MKRTTASLLTGALATGTFAVLATVTPGIASANCATNIPVTSANLNGWALGRDNSGVGASATINEEGLVLQVANDGRANAMRGTGVDGAFGAVPLASQTAQSDYGIPGASFANGLSYQLRLDLDSTNDTFDYAGLVYEDAYADGTWWSTRDLVGENIRHDSTNGSATNTGNFSSGTLADISAAYPNAVIYEFGIQQGSGTPAATATVATVRFGCNTFDFGNPPVEVPNNPPVANLTVADAGDNDYRTYFLDARAEGNESTDPDGDALTYEIYVDDVLVTTNPQYLFEAPSTGSYDVRLVVSDGSDSSQATATIDVTIPAPTTQGEPLPNTGANVVGLAVLGGLAVAGAGTGLVVRNRRSSNAAV